MKASVYEGIDQITVKELPAPAAGPGELLVRVKACAVCGSDIRIFHSGNSRVIPPQTLGHEIAGEVVEAGAGVTKFAPGDRVAIGADVPCGQCAFCEAGLGNNCQINYAVGYQFPGGFAEYILLNNTTVNYGPVHRLPDSVSFDEGALAEPLACALNALERTPVRLNDTVVLIGAGPLGMMLCSAAKAMGASKTILINRSRPRLAIAERLGIADVYVCSSEENDAEAVLSETNGLGADVIFTASPSPEAQVGAVNMAKNRAQVNFFGGLPKDKGVVPLDTNRIHYKELLVTGSHGSLPIHHRKALELIAGGIMDVKPFITHHFGLNDILRAFEAAEKHEGLRVIVNP